MIQTVLKSRRSAKPKVSFVLLDWGCRESFHSLDYLSNQTVPRDNYEIVWIEYYSRMAEGLSNKIVEYSKKGRASPVDLWLIMGMPDQVYYHKHLMYNVGIANSSGDIIIICDSDAMFTPQFVETVIDCYERDPNIVLHFDEVRNSRQDLYPFCYPDFEMMTGEGAINWRDGKTTGLWDTEDRLHSLNYGACFCARRADLIAIGGADEHMDYLGHVCGPYELTFRLVNKGLKEIWHEREFLYHSWHPGQDGDVNYIGPSDGRHMSTTALEAIKTGRIMPLLENKAIRLERERGIPGPMEDQIDPAFLSAWTHEEVKKNPRFRMWKRSSSTTKLLEENKYYNVLGYDDAFFAVLHSLGPIDLTSADDRARPGVYRAETLEEAKRLIEQSHGQNVQGIEVQPSSDPTPDVMVPVLVHQRSWYNIVAFGGGYFGLPHNIGPCDLSKGKDREIPGIVHGQSVAEIDRQMIESLGAKELPTEIKTASPLPPPAASDSIAVSAAADIPVAPKPPGPPQPPKLLNVLGTYNIVHYDSFYYAIPQKIGDINLTIPEQRNREEILSAPTQPRVEDKVRNQRLSILERELSARGLAISRLQEEVVSRDSRIAEKENEISARNAEIASRDARIAEQETEISVRDAEIANRDTRIAEQEASLQTLAEDLKAAQDSLVKSDSCYGQLPTLDVWERNQTGDQRSVFRSIGRCLLPLLMGDRLYGWLKWRWLKMAMPMLPSAVVPVPVAIHHDYQIVAFQGRFFAVPAQVTESERSLNRLWGALGIIKAATMPRLKRQILKARIRG